MEREQKCDTRVTPQGFQSANRSEYLLRVNYWGVPGWSRETLINAHSTFQHKDLKYKTNANANPLLNQEDLANRAIMSWPATDGWGRDDGAPNALSLHLGPTGYTARL